MEDHPADLSGSVDGGFYQVDIDQVSPDPNQPRKYFDPQGLQELSESIKQKGVLQPLIIRKDAGNRIFLVAGERRLRAAKMAGLKKIPAILTKGNPMEIAIIENLQRKDLSPIEEAEAFARMIKEHSYTQDQLALVVGKAKSTISELLSLNRLPEEIKEEVRRAEQYPRRLLVEVAKQKTPAAMIALLSQVKRGDLKSSEVREIVRGNVRSKNRTPSLIAIEKIHNLTNHLSKFNLETTEQARRIQLVEELKRLRGLIDKVLG